MFGVNVFNAIENAPDIIEGHYNELLGKNQELSEQRIKICKECPLYEETALGAVCSSKKCWDTVENKLVQYPGKNVVCGCQCRLLAKSKLKGAKCVLNKWEN